MSIPSDPRRWRVGLVGYGEVGRILAEDLRERGLAVAAYDLKLGTVADAPLGRHAAQHGVSLAGSHAELASQADFIVSAVTASQTVAVAESCAPAVRRDAFFLDFNSASPGAKITAAERVGAGGARYVEAAVMTAIAPYRIRVPLLLGGGWPPRRRRSCRCSWRSGSIRGGAAAAARGPRVRRTVASDKFGVASATKMCRSVIVKGLEAMVIESFTAARAYGVEDQLLASLAETFPGIDWEKQGGYFFQRAIQHGRRRAEEMREATETVREAGLEPWSAVGHGGASGLGGGDGGCGPVRGKRRRT